MAINWGLGPVFRYEWLAVCRRWQMYALRSGFVGALLVNLAVVWWAQVAGRPLDTVRAQAGVGQWFFVAIAGTVLALVCLAAPAVAAGAVCLDRARGTLEHLLVTDLSDAEIVLGKLAVRLLPAIGLVASTWPVMALGTLLGGIDPDALLGTVLVTLGCAVGGCAVALVCSVWASKMHEALLATYAVGIIWVAALPIWMVQPLWAVGVAPAWLAKSNPFWLIFGAALRVPPVASGLDRVTLADQAVFLLGSVLVSAALAAVAVLRMRAVAVRSERRGGSRAAVRWRLGPTLDGNPVLWREWFRRQPSRWTRRVWATYAVLAGAFSLGIVMQNLAASGPVANPFAPLFNAGQVTVGLLLLSVSASSALAEERAQGSLAAVLATPLSTRQIVWGKWWGTYRTVPLLAVLPGLVALGLARHSPSPERWIAVPLLVGLVLAQGAAITSLGLVLATRVANPGRAVVLTVTAYVLVTVGWVFLVLILFQNHARLGPGLAAASPFIGTLFTTLPLAAPRFALWRLALGAAGFWIVAYTAIAWALLQRVLADFERCLGRMPETTGPRARPGRPRPPVELPPLLFKDRLWEWS